MFGFNSIDNGVASSTVIEFLKIVNPSGALSV